MRTPITHPLNVSYLVVGLVFLGISGCWALRTAGIVDDGDIGWLLPLVLVTAGIIGLVAFATKGFTRIRAGADHRSDDDYVYDDIWSDTTEGDLR
jgi:hypothetical protein